MIGSPLRFPGGKSRATQQILERLPRQITDFREPFVGGGSVFLAVRQQYPEARVWINDANENLMAFWTALRDDPHLLAARVQWFLETHPKDTSGKGLYREMLEWQPEALVAQGARFFVLNRITFSGTVESGGFSQQAFERRFTQSSIDRLALAAPLVKGVKMTCGDYRSVIQTVEDDAVLFLDPPYKAQEQSKLYGKNGDLHKGFDHASLAMALNATRCKWLMTYDDSPPIRALYEDWADLETWELQYGMNNSSGTAAKGSELFISRSQCL